MPTPKQVQLIHVAKSKAGLTEPQYRLLLHNVAGVDSCKQLTQATYEDVMAVLEDSGFRDSAGGDYWRAKVRARGCSCGDRMRRKIEAMTAEQVYPLPALVRRMSDKRTDRVEELYPREAWNLIEALKAIVDRETESVPTPRQLALIKTLAGVGRQCLPEICETVSNGRSLTPEGLNASEIDQVIQGLRSKLPNASESEDDDEVPF